MLSGELNIFGLQIDLGKILSSPETLREQMGALRERLKQTGATETLSDDDWSGGAATVSGGISIRGLGQDRDYHLGTSPRPRPPRQRQRKQQRASASPPPEKVPDPPEVVEPVTDVFYEDLEILVISQVPGIDLEDLSLSLEGQRLTLSTRPQAAWQYRKTLELQHPVIPGSLKTNCRNGIMEARLARETRELV